MKILYYPKLNIVSRIAITVLLLTIADQVAAGSEVEVVRGSADPAYLSIGKTEPFKDARYALLSGGSKSLRFFDTRTNRIGTCFKVNTFALANRSKVIRCRWRVPERDFVPPNSTSPR